MDNKKYPTVAGDGSKPSVVYAISFGPPLHQQHERRHIFIH